MRGKASLATDILVYSAALFLRYLQGGAHGHTRSLLTVQGSAPLNLTQTSGPFDLSRMLYFLAD